MDSNAFWDARIYLARISTDTTAATQHKHTNTQTPTHTHKYHTIRTHIKYIKFHYQTLFKNMQISLKFRACIFRYHCHAQLIKMHPFLQISQSI